MKKETKKPIQSEVNQPLPYTEGHWEDVLDEIETLEKFQPSGNMGSWWRQIKLDKLKAKLKCKK
jgi:hypothetical protein